MNLNAEVLRQLSYIIDDEKLMTKALKNIKKLVEQKHDATAAKQTEAGQTKEDILNHFDQACK